MQDSFRRSTLTLPLPAPLAVGVGQVTYTSPRSQRIVSAQLCESDNGTGNQGLAVNINVNGVQIAFLEIPGATVNNSYLDTMSADVTVNSNFPGGFRIDEGDVVTVDVALVPATTVPKAAFVALDMLQIDI